MRSLFPAFLFLCITVPASASWWPVWNPREVHMTVGDTTTVQVYAMWSGLVDYGNGVHWTFTSDNGHVAAAEIYMDNAKVHDVTITANAAGVAVIREKYDTGRLGSVPWVTVYVDCGVEPAPVPVSPRGPVLTGEPVTLAVVSPIADRTAFTWYTGEIGDTSHPLDASGPSFVYTPSAQTHQAVWVRALTQCSTNAVQFRIEAVPPKHRAGRK